MMTLTDDQRMLADTVAPFMADEGAISKQLRHWRDKGCNDGFGHGLWKQLGELGLTGILVPEANGGAGLGQVEANIVLEEIGRNLTPSPFLTTAVAAAITARTRMSLRKAFRRSGVTSSSSAGTTPNGITCTKNAGASSGAASRACVSKMLRIIASSMTMPYSVMK